MLSLARRGLPHPSLISGKYGEYRYILSGPSHYCSNKNGKDDPDNAGGTSQRATQDAKKKSPKLKKETMDILLALFPQQRRPQRGKAQRNDLKSQGVLSDTTEYARPERPSRQQTDSKKTSLGISKATMDALFAQSTPSVSEPKLAHRAMGEQRRPKSGSEKTWQGLSKDMMDSVIEEVTKPLPKVSKPQRQRAQENLLRSEGTRGDLKGTIDSTMRPQRQRQQMSEGRDLPKYKMSKMKTDKLNTMIASAATKVAAKAGSAKDDVLYDLLEKVDETFAGKKRPKHEKVHEGVVSSIWDPVELPASRITERKYKTMINFSEEAKPYGIFSEQPESVSEVSSERWEGFLRAELCRRTIFEPLNWFDQCKIWTEEGKLWHFPIDNEQGIGEEAEVDFTEHIFLDQYIEDWCPREGPIKQFMELVCIGLSKNPYLTAAEKRENLEWYRRYFAKHQTLLEELDVLGSSSETPLLKEKSQ